MADAVLNERFLSGVAPLAIAFLILFGLVVFVAGCALLAKAVQRYRETDAEQTRAIDDTVPEPTTARAIRDTTPGTNLAALDECELIWSASDYIDPAGIERLRATIRDHQQRGEQA